MKHLRGLYAQTFFTFRTTYVYIYVCINVKWAQEYTETLYSLLNKYIYPFMLAACTEVILDLIVTVFRRRTKLYSLSL